MARSRLPMATEEEVVRALDELNQGGNIKMRSALSVAGIVAQGRGCPDSWPTKDAIAKYVSLSSVKAMLEHLVAEGKAYAVPGNHWAVVGRVSSRYTYYLNEHGKQAAEKQAALNEARRRTAKREEWTNHELRQRFAELLGELNEEWEQKNPPTDWSKKW
jgi:predicted MPP superfamily phosphohydrolase